MRKHLALAAILVLAIGVPGPAWADDDGWRLSEIRFGLLAHDEAPIVNNKETGIDYNADVLFTSPHALRGIGAPRPYLGVSIASVGASNIHAGVSWDYDFSSRWFVTGGLGLAAHDGDPLQEEEQTPHEHLTEKALGCRVVFHLYVGLGYRLSRRWNIATHYEHLSNATLCPTNEGLENIGIQIGRTF